MVVYWVEINAIYPCRLKSCQDDTQERLNVVHNAVTECLAIYIVPSIIYIYYIDLKATVLDFSM